MALPNFVILGAQKSASTYLAAALSRHPQVYMPTHEVRFFEDPDYSPKLTALEALFQGKEQFLLGIKRPDYFGREEVPVRLKEHLPDVRLITLLREPVSRLVSAYYYYVKLGFLPAVDINAKLPGILRRYPDVARRERELLDYGRYGTHLARYRDHFPAEQILVLIQDDMKISAQTTLDAACDFLQLPRLEPTPRIERANSGLYSIQRLKWLRNRNRFFYRVDPRSGSLDVNLTPVNLVLGGAITAIDRYLLAPLYGNAPPRLNACLRHALVKFYADEIVYLEQLLGRRLVEWR